MTRPLLLGELVVGEVFTGRSTTVTESHVVQFAGLTGDFYPLHMSEQHAAETQFGQRIAHGLLTFTIAAGAIASELTRWQVVAALGFDAVRFTAPVFFGDTVTPSAVVTDIAPRSGRGTVTLAIRVASQKGEEVLTSTMRVLVSA